MSLKRELGTADTEDVDVKKTKTTDIRSLRGMDIEKVVGSGTFGVVFKATIKLTGERVALKKFKLEIDPQGQGFPMQALREIRILKAVKLQNHVNIVKLFTMVTYVPGDDDEEEGVSRQTTHGFAPGDIFMVFEYVDYDLSGLLKCRDVKLTDMHIRSYTKQLLEGVNFLHLNKILHRDIKGPNILVTRENVIKIADLGLARSYRSLDQKFTNSNSVVTLWYRSPELLLGTRSYGPEVDIWSVGCLFGEMKTRDAILKGTSEAEQLEIIYKLFGTPTGELDEQFSKLPEYSSEKMQFKTVYPSRLSKDNRFSRFDNLSMGLFTKLLDVNPRTRITAVKAIDDDYFWLGENVLKPEDLPRFTVAVATDMSETDRMKAERAAKIATEEERIKAEKEKDHDAGGPGSVAGRGRMGGRGVMGRGRQALGSSKYAVSKPMAGRGGLSALAASAVSAGSIGTATATANRTGGAGVSASKPALAPGTGIGIGSLVSPTAPSSSAQLTSAAGSNGKPSPWGVSAVKSNLQSKFHPGGSAVEGTECSESDAQVKSEGQGGSLGGTGMGTDSLTAQASTSSDNVTESISMNDMKTAAETDSSSWSVSADQVTDSANILKAKKEKETESGDVREVKIKEKGVWSSPTI